MVRQLIGLALIVLALAARPDVNAAFDAFWAAESPEATAAALDDILKSGITFDGAYGRLKQGRTYTAAPTGMVRLSSRLQPGSIDHHFVLNIPASYDPAKKYQVRFQLHGGVGGRFSNEPPPNAGGPGSTAALEGPGDVAQIYIVPFSWNASPWWSTDQVLNLHAILDLAKRSYNLDQNRVVVSGVSDGGTGAYYVAMRDTTPYASFLPLNGYVLGLRHTELAAGD